MAFAQAEDGDRVAKNEQRVRIAVAGGMVVKQLAAGGKGEQGEYGLGFSIAIPEEGGAEQCTQKHGNAGEKAQTIGVIPEQFIAQSDEPLAEGRLQVPIVGRVSIGGDDRFAGLEHFVGADAVAGFIPVHQFTVV